MRLALGIRQMALAIGKGFSFGRKDPGKPKPYGSSSLSQ